MKKENFLRSKEGRLKEHPPKDRLTKKPLKHKGAIKKPFFHLKTYFLAKFD